MMISKNITEDQSFMDLSLRETFPKNEIQLDQGFLEEAALLGLSA
jgi:hypothetical protein